ncbi:hypothetical protein ABFV55_27535, partial [Pseudomonas syringae]|uniref:hypothetical protein n=1 Tax=Pseudomonas syringae TaxID=317 RepID=UPI0034D9665F
MVDVAAERKLLFKGKYKPFFRLKKPPLAYTQVKVIYYFSLLLLLETQQDYYTANKITMLVVVLDHMSDTSQASRT